MVNAQCAAAGVCAEEHFVVLEISGLEHDGGAIAHVEDGGAGQAVFLT